MRLPPAWLVAVPPGGIDDELARQKQIADRFMAVLARNPRRGTALDRIYSFHLENGSLEVLVAELRERTVKNLPKPTLFVRALFLRFGVRACRVKSYGVRVRFVRQNGRNPLRTSPSAS